MPAITMAIQVRRGSLWPSKARANSAVTSGPSAMMTRTLATLVSVSAIMKAVNITDQQTPEIQTMRGERRMLRQTDGPRRNVRMTVIASALKKLRQKVTSKLCAESRWRVTTPAMLQSSVTRIISETARAWVIEVLGMRLRLSGAAARGRPSL